MLLAWIRRQILPAMSPVRPKLAVRVDDVRISRLLRAIRMMLIEVILQKLFLCFGREVTLS